MLLQEHSNLKRILPLEFLILGILFGIMFGEVGAYTLKEVQMVAELFTNSSPLCQTYSQNKHVQMKTEQTFTDF